MTRPDPEEQVHLREGYIIDKVAQAKPDARLTVDMSIPLGSLYIDMRGDIRTSPAVARRIRDLHPGRFA